MLATLFVMYLIWGRRLHASDEARHRIMQFRERNAITDASLMKQSLSVLALGACLGGNGSLIGASANLIVAGFAERAGHRIKFLPFMLLAFPLMLLSIVIATFYIYFRYL